MSKTIILMGKPGAGKGTQAKLICDILKQSGDVLHIETGQIFREYIHGGTHSSHISKELMNAGLKQPDFLAVLMWGNIFMEKIKTGKEHIVIDGAPRALAEAMVFNTTMEFYGRKLVNVFMLGVIDKIVTERMIQRGMKEKRKDDNPKDIATRLEWFKKDVMPAAEYFRNQIGRYRYKVINGVKTPPLVLEDILSVLGPL